MSPRERWPAILLRLHRNGWQRAADLAAALGVSTRTIYRDMQALDSADVPIEAVPGKGYRLPEAYLLDPVTLTLDEAVTLLVGGRYVAGRGDIARDVSARTARRKLERLLPPAQREAVAALSAHARLLPEDTFGHVPASQHLTELRRALDACRTVTFRDDRAPRPDAAERIMNPYGLVRQASTWYLIGFAHGPGRVLHVPVDCVHDLRVLDETFERPDGYRSAWDGGSQRPRKTLRLLFSAESAPSIQLPPWLRVQGTDKRADGRLLMTVRMDGERDPLPWLLSWGTHVHVVAPRALRQRLAREARDVAAQYRDEPLLVE